MIHCFICLPETTDENEDERAVELLDDCETADNCSQTNTSVQSWGCYQSYCQCALGFFYQVSTSSCINSMGFSIVCVLCCLRVGRAVRVNQTIG